MAARVPMVVRAVVPRIAAVPAARAGTATAVVPMTATAAFRAKPVRSSALAVVSGTSSAGPVTSSGRASVCSRRRTAGDVRASCRRERESVDSAEAVTSSDKAAGRSEVGTGSSDAATGTAAAGSSAADRETAATTFFNRFLFKGLLLPL